MIAALNYTPTVSMKAAGPVSQPVAPLAHSAIIHEFGAFLRLLHQWRIAQDSRKAGRFQSPVLRILPNPPPHFAVVASVPSPQLWNSS